MSTATISYSSLKNASTEAKRVASRMTTYADNLNSSVYNKLTSYEGSCTGNITTAKNRTRAKIRELEKRAAAYETYAADLSDLREQCENTDRTVKTMVSQLTADFRDANGISSNKVSETINYYLTSFSTATFVHRWLGTVFDKATSIQEYIQQSFEDWWDYEGGEQLITGVAAAVATLTMAIAAVIATGFALVSIIALALAVLNFCAAIQNESDAYYATHYNEDPATGKREHERDTWADTLRDETDSQWLHGLADALDFAQVVCDVVNLINSVQKLVTNGVALFENLSSGGWTALMDRIKGTVSSLTSGKFSTTMTNIAKKIQSNLAERYWNFSNNSSFASSVKNVLSALKDVFSDGLQWKDVLKNLILPSVVIADNIVKITEGEGGQMKIDLEKIKALDIYSIITSVQNLMDKGKTESDSSSINTELLEALTKKCGIHIEVPEINIPSIDLDPLRAVSVAG